MNIPKTRRRGFTLIEMLVVIAIIALLASILVPAVTNALGTANKTRVMSNGRSIYLSIFSTITDVGASGTEFYAEDDSTDYTTSTDYFAWLMRDLDGTDGAPGQEVLKKDFNMFAAQGVPAAEDLTDFTEDGENNAWSVVTEITADSDASNPFLVTRNLNESTLQTWTNADSDRLMNVGTGTYSKPYEDTAIIAIRAGGGGDILNERSLLWAQLNPNKLDQVEILEPGNVP